METTKLAGSSAAFTSAAGSENEVVDEVVGRLDGGSAAEAVELAARRGGGEGEEGQKAGRGRDALSDPRSTR